MLKGLFGKTKQRSADPIATPEAMKPEDPVNYNSVLDYLVGLSNDDFKKMTKSAEIYRKANREVANLLDIEDEPTTAITTEKPEITDDDLDNMLEHGLEFIDDGPAAEKPKKAQASEKKVEVKE